MSMRHLIEKYPLNRPANSKEPAAKYVAQELSLVSAAAVAVCV